MLDDNIDLIKWQFPITIEERQLGGDFDSAKTSIPSAASSVDGLAGVSPSLVEGLSAHCSLTSYPMTIGVDISKLMEADLQVQDKPICSHALINFPETSYTLIEFKDSSQFSTGVDTLR